MTTTSSINISPQTPVFTGSALSMAFAVGQTPIESFDLTVDFDPAVLKASSLAVTGVASGWTVLLNVVGSSIFISGYSLSALPATSALFTLTGNLEDGASRDLYLDLSGTYNDPAVTIPSTSFSFLNSAPSGEVSVSGSPTQAQTLNADTSTLADADGLGAFSYQWQADGSDIVGATAASLLLTQNEVGRAVRVVVRYTDGRGVSESVTSSATAAVANVNDAPTGGVSVTGTPTQGQTLSANTSSLADLDGLGALSYQWQADGSDIAGATSSSLTLTQAQVGKAIRVIVSYTDALGSPETVTSSATSAVANVNDAPTGGVSVTGTPTQGQTLSANTSALADLDGLGTLSYQWQADGADIEGATSSSLVLNQAQVGKAIRVIVSYTDALGSPETVTSSATSAVANVNDAPTGSVTISGTPTQGQTLSADTSTLADLDGLGTLSYQWQADGSDIAGATASSLVLAQAQVGKAIRVIVSYTDALGSPETITSSASSAVANVNDAPTGGVSVTGTPTQGQTLSANTSTLADLDGLGALSYQWQADGSDIAGATSSSLTLTQAQVGKAIRVVVSYTDALGSPETVTSSATSAVANINDAPTGEVSISGTPTQGQTLSAANTLADLDGIPTSGTNAISYQWKANGTAISGATSNVYVLTQAEVGKTITVSASYTDDQGTPETVTSSATAAVANVNDAPTGGVSVTGTPTQGQTLSADTSTLADLDGLGTLSYQWQSDGSDIAGANSSSLTLTQAQVGKAIRVIVSYTDALGSPETVTSSATSAVANLNDAPTGGVTISGLARQGQTLTLDTSGLADPDGLGPLSYQWQADGVNIAGATASTLVLTQAQVGKAIRALVSYTDGFGQSESVTSAPSESVGNVNDLGGLIYHWKNHALLGSVQLSITSREAGQIDTAASILDLRALSSEHIPGTGQGRVTVQVWVNATAGDANFDFRVSTNGAQAATFTSSLGGSWTVLANTFNPDEIAIGGFDSEAGLSGGPIQLGTLQFDYGASTARADLRFTQISVGENTVADRALAVIGTSTDTNGSWSVVDIPNDHYSVLASRPVTDVGNAVTSADALAALRIAVSLNPNPDPDGTGPLQPLRTSPYQFMAADANGSGTVTSADALAILRMAVKLPTALLHEWFFVDESRDFWNEVTSQYTLTRTAASVEKTIPTQVDGDSTLNLVGVLKGDVDGSWTAPAGSPDLDIVNPTYFTQLAARMAVPTDQWGI